MEYLDFYGLPVKIGDYVFPISGTPLISYNAMMEYFKEIGIKDYRPNLVIVDNSYQCKDKTVKYICLEYVNYELVSNFDITRNFTSTEDFKEYTTMEHFESEEKKHKYVLTAGKRIKADNIVDTGFKDIDGEIIYNTSILREAFDERNKNLYIMIKTPITDKYVLVQMLEPDNYLDISFLDNLEIIWTEETL